MSQQNTPGIDVSKEEERYLRRAFRRFALPYVLVFGAVAWVATTAVSGDGPTGSPKEMSELHEELSALKQAIAALEGRVEQVGGKVEKAGRRMGALETQKPRRDATSDTSALERDLRDATRRVAQLEKRMSNDAAPASERIDALAARMRRIEDAARQASAAAAATPAPAAPASAAPAPAGPTPEPAR
jgi:prefoldin subunit 5